MIKTVLFASLLILSSCAQNKQIISEAPKSDENVIVEAVIGDMNEASDAVTIQNVSLNGNILEMTVSYGGGCNKHSFSLIGSSAISKSLPPRRSIKLVHHAMGDNCKKIITEKLYFSIGAFAYQKELGSSIILDLNGFDTSINYTYP